MSPKFLCRSKDMLRLFKGYALGRAYYRKELCVLKRVRLDIKTLRQLSKPSQADVQGGYRGDAQGGYRGDAQGG